MTTESEERAFRERAQWLMFTIHHVAEHPGEWIVSATPIKGQADPRNPAPLPHRWRFPSLEDARSGILAIKPGAALFPRDPSDAPSVVESWF